eukprot:196638-Amphidinium_carterae.1
MEGTRSGRSPKSQPKTVQQVSRSGRILLRLLQESGHRWDLATPTVSLLDADVGHSLKAFTLESATAGLNPPGQAGG